jgi:ParB-like chromosome segregation protein Spo0J
MLLMPIMASRIELWRGDRLIPRDSNSRTHSREQVTQIAASIQEFGSTNPVVAGPNGTVLVPGTSSSVSRIPAINPASRYPVGPV